ncbi:PREDICTED: protein spire homolog 2-like [Colobus angolensis palliatus]|uniref:protein spire homolog 2-like n=1 Tax=Colobus angolensis palliatus TaxID=336983 RepID=UPI0005F54437|nr:PREDICTED: protein spire homolog 2-like [Colobus angolensis palliatus]
MLQKLREDEPQVETPQAELDSLGHTDWARLWVQLMRELRHGVKLKKVQEQEFNPLPTEFQLTPFEMLMQDIRARNYKLRKVMVDGDIPPRVKKDAHELILDFIRSRPPLKQVSERRLRPLPPKQRSLHEKILEEIKQERRLRPVRGEGWAARGERGDGRRRETPVPLVGPPIALALKAKPNATKARETTPKSVGRSDLFNSPSPVRGEKTFRGPQGRCLSCSSKAANGQNPPNAGSGNRERQRHGML